MNDIKKFRVCLSSKLPPEKERDPHFIYFTYDNLRLYSGYNEITDNFIIADKLPEDPIINLLYILNSDGTIHEKIEATEKGMIDNIIAKIEDPAQLELLKKVGTMFYINSQHRYIDTDNRSLVLPFNNIEGYNLVASARKDQIFNNDTILKYDEEEEKFKVYSGSADEFIDFGKLYRGGITNSAKIDIAGARINGSVKLSKATDNIIKYSSDGLYAYIKNKVDIEQYNSLLEQIEEFNKKIDNNKLEIKNSVSEIEDMISTDITDTKISNKLSELLPQIESYINNYESIKSKLDNIEEQSISLALNISNSIVEEIRSNYEKDSKWEELDEEE